MSSKTDKILDITRKMYSASSYDEYLQLEQELIKLLKGSKK